MNGIVGGILAGGYAKRLRPLTDTTPKSLIEIKPGYTVLDKQLLSMKMAGISTVYLLVGHLKEKIKERYSNSWRGLEIRYIEEEEPMGTVYGIRELLKRTGLDALVMNGDVVTDVNLKRMITKARRGKGLATMFVVKLKSPYGIVELQGDKIASFVEKPELPYYINGGIYYIPASLKSYFEPYERGDVEKLVFPTLAEEGLLAYYKEDGVFWRSIDSLKDLEEVRREFEKRVDTGWGYEKNLVELEELVVREVYVMRGYAASIKAAKSSVHVTQGRGITSDGRVIEAGVTIKVEDKLDVTALENLKLHVYSPSPS